MSKPVKNLIIESYKRHFADVDGAVVVDLRGVASNDNNAFRADLLKKQMRVTIVKNALARVAFNDTSLAGLKDVLDGPSALVYGGETVVQVARELLELTRKKEYKQVQIRGAVMEGEAYPADRIDALSKMPTRDEAVARLVNRVLSAGGNLVSGAKGPGAKVAGILKTIQDKLEKGETIAKVA